MKKNGQEVRFTVTDTHKTLPVVYRGLLPDLFREGQGVVAEGTLGADGVFTAREVLAKHDENYMPPEVAKALKEAGQWRAKMRSIDCCRRSLACGAARTSAVRARRSLRCSAAARRRFASLQAPYDPRARPLRADPGARRRAGAGDACRSSARRAAMSG